LNSTKYDRQFFNAMLSCGDFSDSIFQAIKFGIIFTLGHYFVDNISDDNLYQYALNKYFISHKSYDNIVNFTSTRLCRLHTTHE